jgi:hypothetical protein
MNATPPEANTEYSTRGGTFGAVILAGGLLGALLLLVAEFTTLFEVRSSASTKVIRSVGTGSHHSYALLPIALLVVFFAWGVWQARSRPALLAIGVLGVLTLLIALLGDLPDAHASGLIGSSATHYTTASSRPSAGMYMETAGAVVLIITCVSGFLLIGSPAPPRRTERPGPASGLSGS